MIYRRRCNKELLNRVKFGFEGALFTGVMGGTGTLVKKLTNRNKQLDVANSKLDRFIDRIASGSGHEVVRHKSF